MSEALDQERAAHAGKVIDEVLRDLDAERRREFGTQLQRLPARIRATGLGQALAFLHARAYAPALLAALEQWVAQWRPLPAGEKRGLLERLVYGDADFQRQVTAEVLAYLPELVRRADGRGLTANVQES